MVFEYLGEYIFTEEFETRKALRGSGELYFAGVAGAVIVDATRIRGYARFVNHSCDPNATLELVTVDRLLQPVITLSLGAVKGEQVTIDYGGRDGEGLRVPCDCREQECRKWLWTLACSAKVGAGAADGDGDAAPPTVIDLTGAD
eukprot:1973193-Rhodomonas_salina.1